MSDLLNSYKGKILICIGLLALFVFIFLRPKKCSNENFGNDEWRGRQKIYAPGAYLPRPEENGFVRPLWGKDMTVPSENMLKHRYNTFESLTQCMPPLKTEFTPGCNKDVEVPYSYNKI